MRQIFVPSTYIGGPCAILDLDTDGSCADMVTIVENNPHGVPDVFLIDLNTLNTLTAAINAEKQKHTY